MSLSLRPLLILSPLLACCYEYVPARNPATLTGERVQLTLTDSGSVVLASSLGRGVESLEGTFLADSAGRYRVAVLQTHGRGGDVDWRGEQVTLQRDLVSSLAQRRFSPSRSAFAGALATAGVVGATAGLRGTGKGGGQPPVPGPVVGQ